MVGGTYPVGIGGYIRYDIATKIIGENWRLPTVEEYQELLAFAEHCRAILASEQMVRDIIKEELLDLKERFGDERKTTITHGDGEIDISDLAMVKAHMLGLRKIKK